jgi:hypothetical protein
MCLVSQQIEPSKKHDAPQMSAHAWQSQFKFIMRAWGILSGKPRACGMMRPPTGSNFVIGALLGTAKNKQKQLNKSPQAVEVSIGADKSKVSTETGHNRS